MQKSPTYVPIWPYNYSAPAKSDKKPEPKAMPPSSYLDQGDVLVRSKNFEDALKNYKTALQLNQGSAQAWEKVAYCYFNLGQFDKAVNYYTGSLKLVPNSKIYCNLGLSYININKFAEALQCFDYALKHQSNLEVAIKNREICLQQLSLQHSADKKTKSPSPSETKPEKRTSGRLDGVQNSAMKEEQLKIQKIASKKHVSRTQFDAQIAQLSQLIKANHCNILAYGFRAYYFLRANMATEFERDIQEAIWITKKSKLTGAQQELLDLMSLYMPAYGQTINYLKGMTESPTLPTEKKNELRIYAGNMFFDMFRQLKEEMNQGKCDLPRYQEYYQTLLAFNKEMHNYLESQAKGQSKIEKPKTLQQELTNSIAKFTKATSEYLNTDQSLEFFKQQNTYFVTLSKLIYTIVKLFMVVQDNIDINSSNEPNRAITKEVITAIIKHLQLTASLGIIAQTLQHILETMFDLKYRGKEKSVRAKFCHLIKKYEDPDYIDSAIIRSVKTLASQPSKKQQILSAFNNQMIHQELDMEIKLSRLVDSLVATVEETKDFIMEILNEPKSDIPKSHLLACKDFTVFLTYIFRTEEFELKSLEQIIISELVDEAYIPKIIDIPSGLSVLMNASNRYCLFSSEQMVLGLTETRVIIWEFLEVSSGIYNIRNLSSMKFVNWKDQGIYQADCCIENESNWNIQLVEQDSRRAWLIRPATNLKLCLSVETRGKERLKAWQTYFKPVVTEFKQPMTMKNLWYLSLRDNRNV